MAKILMLATLVGVFIAIPACSSEVGKNSNQASVNSNQIPVNSSPGSTVLTPQGDTSAPANVSENGANTAPVVTIDPANTNKKGQLRESTMPSFPGPDESSFTSTMDKDGNFMEVRTFKNDPMIFKVERKVAGRNSKYLVYLKSGKVVEAPAEKMGNFRVMSPVNILEVIGVKPPQPKVPATVTEKKEG